MRRPRGFTLIEVLAATALFALLGTLLFQVVRGAMDVWTTGERNRELSDRAGAALDLLAEDLRATWPGLAEAAEQDSRFLVLALPDDKDGNGEPERQLPVLAFARLCHEQRSLDWLRRAGDQPAAEGIASLAAEQDPLTLQPTGGLAESLYALAELPGQELPALVRCVRAPLGGTGSLLAEDALERPGRLAQDGVVIADRVLWFAVLCWGPDTEIWARGKGDSAELHAALPVWDSTRGLLGADAFPWAAGPASLLDGTDDLWPRRVRLTLELERDEGPATSGVLAEDLSPETRQVVVASARFLEDEQPPDHVVIGTEWVAVTARDGRTLSVVRGARGTRPQAHAAGDRVRFGRRFERIVELPCGKENWNP